MKRTRMTDDFDGYTVNLLLDDDGDWLAHLVELPNVSAFAGSPEKAIGELKIVWAAVKASYTERQEPVPVAPARKRYSGAFNIRVAREVHRQLAVKAAQEGVSLNALVSKVLAEKMSR